MVFADPELITSETSRGTMKTLSAEGSVATLQRLLIPNMCDAKNLLKFENYSSLKQSPWKNYFYDVYHELPNKYPVCLANFDSFYVKILRKHNLHFPKIYKNKCGPDENIAYWQHSTEPNWIIHLQRFKNESEKPRKNNTWLEVQHRSRSSLSGFEKNGMVWCATRNRNFG